MPTIFTKIINGEIPSYMIAEDDYCFSFLDIFPISKGHTLVIPKKEVDNIFDLDDELYHHLWDFSKRISFALEKTVPCERIGVSVVGLEVPHAHIHLIPINSVSDMSFEKQKLKFSEEDFKEIAESIRKNL